MKPLSAFLLLLTLAVAAPLSGCQRGALSPLFPPKVTPIVTKDGRPGYTIECAGSRRNWAECYAQASTLCGEAGYTQQAKNSGKNYERSLVIGCNTPE